MPAPPDLTAQPVGPGRGASGPSGRQSIRRGPHDGPYPREGLTARPVDRTAGLRALARPSSSIPCAAAASRRPPAALAARLPAGSRPPGGFRPPAGSTPLQRCARSGLAAGACDFECRLPPPSSPPPPPPPPPPLLAASWLESTAASTDTSTATMIAAVAPRLPGVAFAGPPQSPGPSPRPLPAQRSLFSGPAVGRAAGAHHPALPGSPPRESNTDPGFDGGGGRGGGGARGGAGGAGGAGGGDRDSGGGGGPSGALRAVRLAPLGPSLPTRVRPSPIVAGGDAWAAAAADFAYSSFSSSWGEARPVRRRLDGAGCGAGRAPAGATRIAGGTLGTATAKVP